MLNTDSMDMIKTVITQEEVMIEVSRSKFLALLFPCTSVQDFETKLQAIKKQHNSANHHCFAYRIYDSILMERYQDDKEPTGTAGLPILEVLKGNGLSQCGIVVIRYFGGVKLGTGGLSRAYSDAAREVVSLSSPVVLEEGTYLRFDIEYTLGGRFEHYFQLHGIVVASVDYTDKINYCIVVPKTKLDEMLAVITEMSLGAAETMTDGSEWGFFSDSNFTPFHQ